MSLTFGTLRIINQGRCVNELGHAMNTWSVAEWGNATAGECGEACNVAKKMIRVRDRLNMKDKTIEEYRKDLRQEIADLVLYADLWAASEGIDLEEAIIEIFNNKSIELGAKARL